MPKAITPEKFLSEFKPVAKAHFRECLSSWKDYHQATLAEFNTALRSCLSQFDSYPVSNEEMAWIKPV